MLPQGMYLGSFTMFISPDFMVSIRAEDAEAIRSVSVEKLSIFAGKVWDAEDAEALQFAIDNGVNVKQLTAADTITIDHAIKMHRLDEERLGRVVDKGVPAL